MVKGPTKHVQISSEVLGLMSETIAHSMCVLSAFRCVRRILETHTHLRVLLIAGVCEQHLGRYLSILFTAGVCKQHLGGYFRPRKGGLWGESRRNMVQMPYF